MQIEQKLFSKLLGIFSVTMALPLLVSCSLNPKTEILGKWIETAGTEKLEMFKDGTITAADMGVILAGKYTFIDKDRIKVELGGLGASAGPIIVKVAISGDELTWIMPDGAVSEYRRTK